MTRLPLTPDTHRHKAMALRCAPTNIAGERMISIHRAVLETIRNPIVARAVAGNLRCALPPRGDH